MTTTQTHHKSHGWYAQVFGLLDTACATFEELADEAAEQGQDDVACQHWASFDRVSDEYRRVLSMAVADGYSYSDFYR
jgi:hypothetical protein